MTMRRIGSIGGYVDYLEEEPQERSGNGYELAAELDGSIPLSDVENEIQALGGYVDFVDEMYGRNVVFFTINSLSQANEVENIPGVYLVKERYTTSAWQYDPALDAMPEAQKQVVTDYMFLPEDELRQAREPEPEQEQENKVTTTTTTGTGEGNHTNDIMAFLTNNRKTILAIGITSVVIYLLYGRRRS